MSFQNQHREREGGGNLRDRQDPGDKTSFSQTPAEGSRPRFHPSQHGSANSCRWGGGTLDHGVTAIFSVSETAMVDRRRRSQRRPTRMTEHGFACK